ncbi:MAG: hypothetical protein KIS85_06330 [Anaerolineales bacterium]|nr:hypothetical protein [Anaerolineales bacterium]
MRQYQVRETVKVRALKNMVLEVLGVPFGGPFGGRDSYREYFDEQTNLHLDLFPTPPIVYYHGNGADGWPDDAPQYIGKTIGTEEREDGVWFQVLLDEASALARELWEKAKEGLLRASSGSASHLVRIDEETGHIEEWPVVELSLLDISMGQAPANPYAVALPVLKSIYQQAGLSLPEGLETKPEAAEARGKDVPGRGGAGASPTNNQPKQSKGVKAMVLEMTEMDLQAKLQEAEERGRKAVEAEQAAKAKREQEIEDARAEAVKAREAEWAEEKKALEEAATKGRRLPDNPDELPDLLRYAETARYDNLDDGALALTIGVLSAAKAVGRSKGGASNAALKALAIRSVEARGEEQRRRNSPVLQAMKAVDMPLKANELNQTTLADYGDEWVGEAYSNDLWRRIVEEGSIAGKIPAVTVPHGVEAINIPLEGAPPTFYKVAQADDLEDGPLSRPAVTVPASRRGTGKRQLTMGKIGARTVYAGELEEQSFVPWAEELRASIVQEGQEVIDHIVIDGDTAAGATTNINDIGGTPAGTEAFLIADGFRKVALMGGAGANARDAGESFDASDFLETVKLMGLGGRNAGNKDKVEFVLDMWTHWASLGLPEVKTRDVFVSPTIEAGTLTSIWGYRVNATGNMHRVNQDANYGLKANAAGKIDMDTVANNTRGALLAVRYDQWRLGYWRRMTIEVTRYPSSDANEIVALAMLGLTHRDAEAAAISFNVKV